MARQAKILISVAAVVAVAAGAYYWLFIESPALSSKFELDMPEVRRLAGSITGPNASDIRFEHVMNFQAPGAATVTGDSWKQSILWGIAYQLIYPDHTTILDTAMSDEQGKALGTVNGYYPKAYESLIDAMSKASLIAVTHEHPDHIGGLAAHPDLSRLLATSVKLNREQISNPQHTAPVRFPDGAFANYKPIEYDRYYSLAPGIVLIKNPGHTAGSQMIYVRKADGAELLFLGDVAWLMRNVDVVKGKPRFIANKIGEKREAVLPQLAAIHALVAAEPKLIIVPGHDAEAIQELVKRGVMTEGFVR